MSIRDAYQPGVPCWVETVQDDPDAAYSFYAGIFDWEIVGEREYAVARLRGRDVAGIATAPGPQVARAWFTHVRVEDVERAVDATEAAGASVVEAYVDAEPAGCMAVIADRAGAQLCLWQAHLREGAQIVNAPAAWSMSALQTPDPEGASAFYEQAFGWVAEAWGPVTLFRLPGYVGGEPGQPVPRDVVAVMMPSEGPAAWGSDFWVDDVEAVAAGAVERGGSLVAPPFDRPGFRSAVIADPGGSRFSVSERVV